MHLVRRVGGVVRSAIAGGLAHAGVLRRHQAAPRSEIGHDSMTPEVDGRAVSARESRMRRPRTAAPPPPSESAHPGWLVPWRSRRTMPRGRNSRHAPPGPEQYPEPDIACFTPEAFPALTPEACAFLNTPLEECDPDILLFMFSGLTKYLTELPEGAEVPDPMELFATLWDRLHHEHGDGPQNALATAESAAAPLAREAALSDAPSAPDVALTDAPAALAMGSTDAPAAQATVSTGALTAQTMALTNAPAGQAMALPWTPATPDKAFSDAAMIASHPLTDVPSLLLTQPLRSAPLVLPAAPSEPQAPQLRRHVAITAARWETTAGSVPLNPPALRGCCAAFDRDHSVLDRDIAIYHRCIRPLPCRRWLFIDTLLQRPSSRHWCYAARASPARTSSGA